MPRRSKDWNKGLAEDLKDPKFAQAFIMASLEEKISPQDVLRKVIMAYGLKEFSKKSGMPSSNISRALNNKYNPTLDTLNRLLKPFGLGLTVAPIERKKAA